MKRIGVTEHIRNLKSILTLIAERAVKCKDWSLTRFVALERPVLLTNRLSLQ